MARKKSITSILKKRSGNFGKRMVRCFLVLDSRKVRLELRRGGFIGTRELCILSGVPYRSLTRCLPEWVAKGYVEVRGATVPNVGDYEYRLCQHGKNWLNEAQRALPKYNTFRGELFAWFNCVTKPVNYKVLLEAQFDTLVECVNAMSKELDIEWLSQVWLHYDSDGSLVVDNFKNKHS